MQTTDNSVPAEIPRMALRLPPLWAERSAVRYGQAEAQFTLAGISSKQTNFYYVISQLDRLYACEVEGIITITRRLRPNWWPVCPSREQRILQFLTLDMGDRKPSQFLRHLRSLAPDVPDNFLRSIWSSLLPPTVWAILSGQP
jgi:hypothetical protein